MLHHKTIDTSTLELLKNLQKQELLKELRLVGGTCLALQIGHRKSVDIELFGKFDTDEYELTTMPNTHGNVQKIKQTKNIFIYIVNGVKVDIVNYHYPWISGPLKSDGLLLAGMKDIAALKLAAITGRGTKKDFIDIFYLFNYFSLKEMIGFYKQKFPDGSEFLLLKSLSYFDDAETEPNPMMFENYKWENTKAQILKNLEQYHNNLSNP